MTDTPPPPQDTLTPQDIAMLARFAGIKDLDRFLHVVSHQWQVIRGKCANAIARAMVLGVGDGSDEIEALLVLSYRASALAHLTDSIAADPDLRAALTHDPAEITKVLTLARAEAKAQMAEAAEPSSAQP